MTERREPGKRWEISAAVLLLLLAALLRLAFLAEAPPGIFRDELEKGYTALELWQTGRHGFLGDSGITVTAPLPIFIETYEGHDRTSAIYQYFSAPVVGIFGLGVFTTRFMAALAGWMACLIAYLFVRRWLGAVPALIALAALAFHPTGVIFSRWAQQGILLLPLTLAGFWCLMEMRRAAEKHRRVLAVAGGVMLGLAAYAYDPARLTIPVIFAGYLAIQGRTVLKEGWRQNAWALGAFAIIWVPLVVYTLGPGSVRLDRVGVFSGEGELLRTPARYLSHFTFDYWLVSGDANARHRLPANGFAGAGMTLLALVGAAVAIFRAAKGQWEEARPGLFFLAWLLAAPLAAALTQETPHALRANLSIPPVALLAGYAAMALPSSRRAWSTCLAGAVLLLAVDGARAAHGVHRLRSAPGGPWEAGVQEAMQAALARPGTPYLSGAIPYASYVALFAERTDPRQYHEAGLGALRTTILPPGQTPELREGDTFIAPPVSGLPMEYHEETVLIYFVEDGRREVRMPPR